MRKTAKTVIITDGCRGIGAACAKKYAENGFNIVIVGTEGEIRVLIHSDFSSKNKAENVLIAKES